MSTHLGPSSEQAPQAIIPIRPASPETARASSTPASLLWRTLGYKVPSRRTFGYHVPSRRTLGRLARRSAPLV
jgi:hypothetical protein